MTIIEKMLSLVNQKDLGEIIATYTDEYYYEVDLDKHLESWAKKKEHIFKAFGNKLTIEKEVETEFPASMINRKMEEFFKEELDNDRYKLIKLFLKSISEEEVSKNILNFDFIMFDETFRKGMKVSKCFRRLIRKEFLDEVNIKYSMFLQSLKAKGTAVLSIDPVDFLTMSANSSGWRSCHAPDGEYRVGEVAYMMDGCSIISYVKSKEDCILPSGASHANKIWRQIVLLNPGNDYAIQCRQYPNSNDANAATVGKLLAGVLQTENKVEFDSERCEVDNTKFHRLQKSHSCDGLYYNDIEHSAFDFGYVIKPKDVTVEDLYQKVYVEKEIPKAIVGAEVPCLCGCGTWLSSAEYFFQENEGYYDEDNYDEYY